MSTKVLKNGTVLAFDETTESINVLRDTSVLITDGKIATITDDLDNLSTPQDAEIIDVSGKIVSPGFVDTHRHMWQTAYRTLAPNPTVASYFLWLGQFSAGKDAYEPEDIYISSLAGLCDALNGGVTSLVEHAHNNWTENIVEAGLNAAVDSGARMWWCYDPHHRDSFPYEEQLKAWKDIVARHRTKPSLVSLGIAYDDLEAASQEDVDNMKALVRFVETIFLLRLEQD